MSSSGLKKLRENFYKEIKRRALSLESHLSYELKKYQKDQTNLSQRKYQIVETKNLIESAKKRKFIFIGDFHTFDQYQKNALRFLKLYLKTKKKFALALEMVSSDNQYFIDAYLSGQITEREFLESIDYYETWRFPWSHYRHFFQFAKEFNFPIIALNSEGSLAKRDKHAALILTKHSLEFPNFNYITLIGELHILPDNLPYLVKEELNLENNDLLIIHQNIDHIFWDLYNRSMNEDHIIKFNEQEFSINNSPPWLKYESMVYWYEQLLEDPAFDLHEYIMQTGLKTFGPSVTDNFLALSQELNRLFKLGLTQDQVEDFNLHDHQKHDYLVQVAEESSPSKVLFHLYVTLLNKNISFKFYHNNDYYCSNYNLNRIASLVGIHLFHTEHMKINPEYVRNLFLKRSHTQEKFLFFFYEKMFSYLCSKIFNPYLKCDLYRNLENHHSKTISNKAILILDNPNDMNTILKSQDLTALHEISKILGDFFAEMFYQRISHKPSSNYRVSHTFFNTPYRLEDFIRLKEQLLPNAIYRMQRKRKF